MQKKYLIGFLFLLFNQWLNAENGNYKEKEKKERYAFGFIPALAFDSDLGIKYGGVFNIFDYGSTNTPPNYEQYLMVRITNATKGTLNAQALLESETFIPFNRPTSHSF